MGAKWTRWEINPMIEYGVIFIAIVACIVFNEYAKYIVGFYDRKFALFSLFGGIPFLLWSMPSLWKQIVQLDYIAFCRRLVAVAMIGLCLNIVLVSSSKVYQIYKVAVPVSDMPIQRPISFLNSARTGYETIQFDLFGAPVSLRVGGRTVGDLQKNGITGYCVFLALRYGKGYYLINRYWVENCGTTMLPGQ